MKKERNRFLDILKGIAILMVIATHYSWDGGIRLKYLFPYWIDMAVPIFMIITGYVTAKSYIKNGIDSLDEAYRLKHTLRRMIRFTVPFLMAYVIEFLIQLVLNGGVFSVSSTVGVMLGGGNGPGAYYYPVMMQVVFVFPLLFDIIRRHGFKGLAGTFVLTLFLELLKLSYQMGENTYCLLMFRYIFVISFGIWLATPEGNGEYKKALFGLPLYAVAAIAVVIGAAFIYVSEYTGYEPVIINYWTGTSAVACLYIAPIIGVLTMKLKSVGFAPLELLGKASFNIFLVQKIFYFFGEVIYKHLPIDTTAGRLVFAYVISVGFGLLFYAVESRITPAIEKKVYEKWIRS